MRSKIDKVRDRLFRFGFKLLCCDEDKLSKHLCAYLKLQRELSHLERQGK